MSTQEPSLSSIRGGEKNESSSALKWYRLCAVSGVLAVVGVNGMGSITPPLSKGILYVSISLLFQCMVAGLYLRQRHVIGTFGRIGFYAGVLGCLVAAAYRFFIPNPTELFALPTFILAVVFSEWGMIMFGTASLRTGVFPTGALVLFMIGFIQGDSMFGNLWLAFSAPGVLWLGYALWTGKYQKNSEPVLMPDSQMIPERIAALDLFRGLIMIVMAIDHASLYIHRQHGYEIWYMAVAHYQSAAAFLTRFVTHFSAPGFFFAMGAGMILFAHSRRSSGWSEWRIARTLAVRGLFIIALEQLVWNPIIFGGLKTIFVVLFGLGSAMALGTLFLRVRTVPLLCIGGGIVLFTQVIPYLAQMLQIHLSPITHLLLLPGNDSGWDVYFSTVPWLGITVLGMVFGHGLLQNQRKAFTYAAACGVLCLLLFFIVRSIGGFGNFQPPTSKGWIGFLNVVKYPPSLVFTLLTLGVDMIVLFILYKISTRYHIISRPLHIFGKTALFFFMVHWVIFNRFGWFFSEGMGIPPVYVVWAIGLLLIYPICREFHFFKRCTTPDSAWRLF